MEGNVDDKLVVTVAIVLLCAGAIYSYGVESKEIVSNAVAGLLGMVTGMQLNRK